MTKCFPKEFSDLLNKNGMEILNRPMPEKPGNASLGFAADIIKTKHINAIQASLNKKVYPLMKKVESPIANDWRQETKSNFCEKLGKNMKLRSIMMNSRGSDSYRVAQESGLIEMLHSESFKKMGEVMLNRKFGSSVGKQVLCYDDGGYVSPHTDYLPEFPHLKNGYFDIQLMFSNKQVKHQWLIYEQNGYLNNTVDISVSSGIAVYHLPFWHYTTPLMPVNEQKGGARRWLILGSFEDENN